MFVHITSSLQKCFIINWHVAEILAQTLVSALKRAPEIQLIDCKSLNLTVKTHRTLLPPPVIVLLLCVLYIQFLCLLLLFLLSDIVRGLTLSTGSTTRETWAHSPEPSTSNSPQRAAQTRETCKTCSNTMTTLRFACLKREEKQLASDSVTRIRISNGKIEITT